MKKLLVCLLVLFSMFMLVGCNEKETPFEILQKGEVVNVGIIKYVTTPALDNAETGIIKTLEAGGFKDGENIKIIKYNPEAKASTLSQIVETAIKDCDVIFAIATPVVTQLKEEMEKSGINVPVFFTAVTAPVEDKLVNSKENPGEFITGTSDMNPVADQLALIENFNKDGQKYEAKKIGFLYTATESNSIIQLNLLKEKASQMGFEVVAKSITNANDLKDATEALVAEKVDAIYLPTDNVVNPAAKTVTTITNEAKIPTICAEEGYLSNGGLITLSINYEDLGVLTGEMAVKYFKGEVSTLNELPVGQITEFELHINEAVAAELGITFTGLDKYNK